MKLSSSLLLLSVISSSAYANSYNLNTVVSASNQDRIIRELVDTFKRGEVDSSFPISVSGTFELNGNNQLVGINVDHVSFKIVRIPLIGSYETDATIKATIENGNCKSIKVTETKVNHGKPAMVNSFFASDLKDNAAKALEIFINNSDLYKYCSTHSSYSVIFY